MYNDRQLSNEPKANNFLESWKVIVREFPYATKVALRSVSKTFIRIFSEVSPLPALTTQEVRDAQNYLRDHDPKLRLQHDVSFSISPSPWSNDLLVARLFSTTARIVNGQWQDDTIKVYNIPVIEVKKNATQARIDKFAPFSQQQFVHIPDHYQRSQFIAYYLQLPNTTRHPRWKYLEGQSVASLERLILSLKRRPNLPSKDMLSEIEQLLVNNKQESLVKEIKQLKISKALNKNR